MEIRKCVLAAILSLLVASSVLGQSATQSPASPDGGKAVEERVDKKALEKKALALVDEILKEAANLRLPENRIRLQAGAADLLWKHDEKRARLLFKQAMDALGELIAEMAAPQSSRLISRSSDYPARIQMRSELRREILELIARHDPRLARDFLRGTRQSAAIGRWGGEANDQERHIELGLAMQIAATDPSQALQIAQESLENGPLQNELPVILHLLATKDRDAAAKLVSDLMTKLRAVNLTADPAACSVAVTLIRMATNREEDDSESDEKRSRASKSPQLIEERTLRELIEMVAAGALAALAHDRSSASAEGPYYGYLLVGETQSLMPEVEKYAPARAAALKKKLAEASGNPDPNIRALTERKEEIDTVANASVDSLLEAATKAPPEARDALWVQAAMKAMGEGESDRARQIISEHCSDPDERDNLLEQIDAEALQRATEAGRMDEARQLLSQASIEERVNVLTQFAARASTKGDKKAALQMLEEARDLVGAEAANGSELLALLGIARTYATVEPARSFDIVEPVVDHLNRLLAAAAVVDGFEFTGYFKDGELLQVKGSSPLISLVLQFTSDAGALARTDFDRARAIADKFQSGHVRLQARLAVAQGVLSDNPAISVMMAPVSGRRFVKSGVTFRRSAGQVIFQR